MREEVDILILGAGWTSTFLVPLLDTEGFSHAETTTTGRDGTLLFKFNPDEENESSYKNLPTARTVLITFPLIGHGQSKRITSLYRKVHGDSNRWIQLGSTGMFNQCDSWADENSPYDKDDKRAIAEDELMQVVDGCILDLAGLYGGQRQPRLWVPRLVKSKEDIRKRNTVHFVHGEDVAQAIILSHRNFTPKKRWIIADLRVYDWYDLFMSFSALSKDEGLDIAEVERRMECAKWVRELMDEENVKALPRDVGSLGRKLDSRGFWNYHGAYPKHQRLT